MKVVFFNTDGLLAGPPGNWRDPRPMHKETQVRTDLPIVTQYNKTPSALDSPMLQTGHTTSSYPIFIPSEPLCLAQLVLAVIKFSSPENVKYTTQEVELPD